MDNEKTEINPFPRSWMKKEEEDNKPKGLVYFFGVIFWIPVAVMVAKFWWDFFTWLFI